MKKIVYNVQTGETTETDALDIQTIEAPIMDLKTQAIDEIESATTIAGLRVAMLKFINAS